MDSLGLIINLFIIWQFFLNNNPIACSCGNWDSFKNEKCYKVVTDRTADFDSAKSIFQERNASMLVIQSSEEEQFLSNLIFDHKLVLENVWIGLRRNKTASNFMWVNNSTSIYRNWNKYWDWNKNLNRSGFDCIEILAESRMWVNFDCRKKNAVVCQRLPELTVSDMQLVISDLKMALVKLEKKVKDTEDEQRKAVQEIKLNQAPIGFIYIQMPNQTEPKLLFPNTVWSDVSSQYAGHFFRILGGLSAPFGKIQEEASPRITDLWNNCNSCGYTNSCKNITIFRENFNGNSSWSSAYYTGSWGNNRTTDYYTYVKRSDSEVRPRNFAVKV